MPKLTNAAHFRSAIRTVSRDMLDREYFVNYIETDDDGVTCLVLKKGRNPNSAEKIAMAVRYDPNLEHGKLLKRMADDLLADERGYLLGVASDINREYLREINK